MDFLWVSLPGRVKRPLRSSHVHASETIHAFAFLHTFLFSGGSEPQEGAGPDIQGKFPLFERYPFQRFERENL